MSSKLPQRTPAKSGLPKPSSVKRPANDEIDAPERKRKFVPKENKMPPPLSKKSNLSKLRRSSSVCNLGEPLSVNPSRQTMFSTKPKGTNSFATRSSNVSKSLIKKHSSTLTLDRKSSENLSKNAEPKPKTKRAAWDYKGRLEDMEELMKKNNSKFADYDSRMSSLESERNTLSNDLVKSESLNLNATEEITNLKNTVQSLEKEKYEANRKINEQELLIEKLQNQLSDAKGDLSLKNEECISVKAKLTHFMSQFTEIEAEHAAAKKIIDQKTEEIEGLWEEKLQHIQTIEDISSELRHGEMERRKLHNIVQELKGNIRVFCRVRPLLSTELNEQKSISHISFVDEKNLEVKSIGNDKGKHDFKFDRIFSPRESQQDVFEELSQLVQSALDGYNVCVFAYGQTGSGKTFTMEGTYEDPDKEGIIPRSVRQIFSAVDDLKCKGWNYEISASFLEIYNETIRDLLASPKEVKSTSYDIKLTDGKSSEVYITNLKVKKVSNLETVRQLLDIAQQHRAVAATNMNERSSRSHSVFRLIINGKNEIAGEQCEGCINLIDLAGSERLKDSGSEGARLTETQNINKSLANLSNVILALAQKQNHIPYRNSKLTHLLQNSLGGNSKTLMLVNISPQSSHFAETLNSLRFAVKVNQCHIGSATRHIKR